MISEALAKHQTNRRGINRVLNIYLICIAFAVRNALYYYSVRN